MNFLTIEDILRAKERINTHINTTPILTSSLLNRWMGHDIYFKVEGLQKIGAFKARGACNTLAWLIENNSKPQQVVASSSGNHSQALAWAAGIFGIKSTIYMPDYSSTIKKQATKAYGAKVVLCKTRIEADSGSKKTSLEEGTYLVPPFNHEQVIAGQGTAALEAINEIGEVDAVFAPCGGGGLLSGSIITTRALAPKAEVLGVEPLQANDAAESLRKKSIQRLPATPDTLADGAMTMAVGDITFEYLKQLDGMYEVDEPAIIYWTQWLIHLLKTTVEPTSAMSMEAVRQWLSKQSGKKRVLVILSGGNVDQATIAKIYEHDFLSETPGKS